MTDIAPSGLPHLMKLGKNNFLRYSRYIALGVIANAGLWGAALLYLKVTPPVYISKWAMIMPGNGLGVNVSLADIGQTSASSSSPFGGTSMDPRANYQFIITDESVLEIAAETQKIPISKLGKPKVKLVDNTSIMELEIGAKTPEQARDNATAIIEALQSRLNMLRAEEIDKRGENTDATLKEAREKLQIAQKKLSAYKASSGLSSSNQVGELSTNIETLRKQKAEIFAQKEQISSRFQQLADSLGLTVPEVTDAFVLHADRQFLQNARDYSEANTTLTVIRTKWGVNHPLVVKEQARQISAKSAMIERASAILRKAVTTEYIEHLILGDSSGTSRENLFRDLIAFQVDQQGAIAQNEALQYQISQLEDRLQSLVQKQVGLDNLQREVQIAEAVFASTLAKMNLAKSDIFTAYPLVQVLSKPSLPDKKSAPQPTVVFLGTTVGSILITTGLVMLWWRKEIKQKVVLAKSKPVEVVQ
ncbi:GumC family protein [Pseudanabaena yagii]|uniref:Polysaccharide chain length determinant N-terminal domain-containing protein n=1 Tax=Pseudanabaena yagii GIHE-NHR1 TaxID=2722753 RepID=A0ABX1LYU7_9CYAN|nr:hypothetical protein [Pseudanabaena yagii]NMF60526.1 hypothetical protein [Pseudanabaena yagii GIHE-NHR1]